MAVVREHTNEQVRGQYMREIADRCQIDYSQLETVNVGNVLRARRSQAPRPQLDSAELQLLRLALHRPAETAALLHQVGDGAGLDEVASLLVGDELALAAFRALASSETLHAA